MSFQLQMILEGQTATSPSLVMHEDKIQTCIIRLFKTKQPRLKSSRLPPKMKSVQWAARTAGASWSWTQASGCEAVS